MNKIYIFIIIIVLVIISIIIYSSIGEDSNVSKFPNPINKIEQPASGGCVEDFTSCCVGDNCVSSEIECAEGYISEFRGCDLEKCFPKWDCVEFDGSFY